MGDVMNAYRILTSMPENHSGDLSLARKMVLMGLWILEECDLKLPKYILDSLVSG
jgi:hypothetical protein